MNDNIEERIVRAFVRDVLSEGCSIGVSLDRGWDIDDMLLGSRNERDIMAEAFAGDEAHLFIHPDGEPSVVGGCVNSLGWVYIVLGNGADVISDYTCNDTTGRLIAGAERLAERLAEGG